jgi:DNA-binding protein YbaB
MGDTMFKGGKGGLGNMAKMMTELPKVQRIVKESLEKFGDVQGQHDYRGLITFYTQGESIKDVEYSDAYVQEIQNDKDMAQSLMVAGFNETLSKINNERMKFIEDQAKQSKLNPALVQQIFANDLLNSF